MILTRLYNFFTIMPADVTSIAGSWEEQRRNPGMPQC